MKKQHAWILLIVNFISMFTFVYLATIYTDLLLIPNFIIVGVQLWIIVKYPEILKKEQEVK